ncbi:MAG TPA: DUF1080 domain-containing protein [Planctomycetaceae bacterium]|nr:DUF1080 domain-containing protein [Planctomycetaceae bacterium]
MSLRIDGLLVACVFITGGLPMTLTAADGVRQTLFDGRSLDGWVLENDAEVEIVDGNLLLKSGNGWLRSAHQYRDFELELEWKALQAREYDAGIYIRSAGTGKPFPKPTYQVNLLEGKEGHIGSLPGANFQGLIKKGDWNRFHLRVIGDTVALTVNGTAAYKVGGLAQPQGYVGFQIEVPKGGPFQIRNVSLTELDYQPLFNGVDLAGWQGGGAPAEVCWKVEDGLLVCTGEKKGPWLRTEKEYGDFNLRFEYLVSEGGNSGVYVRVPEDGLHHRDNDTLPPAGFEVQLLDDADPQYAKLKDYQYSASVYDIAGADPRVSKPAGQWNTIELNCRGQHVTTVHNGRIVTNITAETHPLLALRKTEGYLGLQNHSTVVKFRNVRIGPAMEYAIGR